MKIKNKSKIKKVLFITLSNIGDIILTTPVLSVLRSEFPDAAIDVMSGPAGREIFSGHPFVSRFISYNKFLSFMAKKHLVNDLRKSRYDLIADMRNSLFPLLIGSRYRTSVIRKISSGSRHKKDRHLSRLTGLGLNTTAAPFAFYLPERDMSIIKQFLSVAGVKNNFIVVAPGAKSHLKRWTKEGFAGLCDRLIDKFALDAIMVGDESDRPIIAGITALMKNKPVDLSSKLTLRQLGALLKRARLLITNDSAPLHVGSAVGASVLAIFGPTDPAKYGPLGKHDIVVRRALRCSPCETAQCRLKTHECMNSITAEEVFKAAEKMLK